MNNKVALSLVGVMAAATFAPQASALPLFARQTGMACNACHFQHFPMLNSFGRSFKASAYTLIGAEGKVEGDNLSIPDTLNAAILTTAGYTKTNAEGSPPNANGLKNDGNGSIFVPGTNGEFSLFVGGRVSENSGALAEIGAVGAAGLASAKVPVLYDLGNGMRAGVVLFTTDGQGASYGFEYLNTGANAVHTMLFDAGDSNGSIGSILSAQQFIGTGQAATGAAFVVNGSMGFINITKFHGAGPIDLRSTAQATGTAGPGFPAGNDTTTTPTSTYLRAAYTFDMAGWDAGAGVQSWQGQSFNIGAGQVLTKATAVDFQMQGTAGDMPLGIYATYARAPASANFTGAALVGGYYNLFNTGDQTRSAITVSAELGVIPEKATVGAGIRLGKSGMSTAFVTGAGSTSDNLTDNGILVDATYKLAQNQILGLYYTKQSGGFQSAIPVNNGGGVLNTAGYTNAQLYGSQMITLNLQTIF